MGEKVKNYNKNKSLNKKLFGVSLLTAAMMSPAYALQSLEDNDLSSVTGQDGISMDLSVSQAALTSQTQYFDTPADFSLTNPAFLDASSLALNGITITPIGADNGAAAAPGAKWALSAVIDAGADTGNVPGASIATQWNRGRLAITSASLGGGASGTLSAVLDAAGKLELAGRGGLFNIANTNAKLLLQFDNADLFLKATSADRPEIIFDNLNFKWDMPQGIVGINSAGLLLKGDVNFNLQFDLRYDDGAIAGPAGILKIESEAKDIPILHFGWAGGLSDATIEVRSGGSWLASSTTGASPSEKYNRSIVSQGTTSRMYWNYKPDFELIVGETDHDGTGSFSPGLLKFGDWKTLPNTTQPVSQPALTTYGYDSGLVVMDVLRTGRGPGGLCWGANWEGPKSSCEAPVHGGQYINVDPDDHSLAVIQRDAFLRAYSSKVTIHDPSNPTQVDRTIGWSLVQTMGNMDGNIFIRPDARTGKHGLKVSGMIMSQTFDVNDEDGDGNLWEQGPNWGYGTHALIADSAPAAQPCETTNKCFGIGLINASQLVVAKDLYINLLTRGVRPGGFGATDIRPGGLSLGDDDLLTASPSTTSPVRIAINARFGGGDVPNMTRQVNISDYRLNLEFDRFHFMLTPPELVSGNYVEGYMGFEATAHFANLDIANFSHTNGGANDPGSFLSLSEPGRPEASIRISNATGWLAVRKGRFDVKRWDDSMGAEPQQLVIENYLVAGRSVKNVAGAELALNNVELGAKGTGGTFQYNRLGSIVIPSGVWYSKTSLFPQN